MTTSDLLSRMYAPPLKALSDQSTRLMQKLHTMPEISNYGNICAKRTLLHRIRGDLNLLHRSVSAPGLLAADQP